METYPSYTKSVFEWLEKTPSHWEEERAKWYFDKIDERSETGEEELLSVSHITGVTPRSEKNVTMFQAESYVGHKLCQPGDLVINSMWAWMAALGVSWHTGIVSSAYGVYRPKNKDLFNPRYLDYLMRIKGYAGEYLCRSKGIWSSRLLLNPEAFFNIPIIRPPLEDQDAIVAFLEEKTAVIDKFIANKKRLIALLEEKKQVVINTAVTQGLDPTVPRKPSGFDWLGDIPAHWEVLQIKRCLQRFEYGISTSLSGKGRYRVLTMGHIQDGQVIIPDKGCLQDKPDLILDNGDLLFNRTNSPELVGKVGLFCGTASDEISFASYLVRLKPKKDVVPEYLNYLLNSLAFINNARQNALVSLHQANLNPTKYSRMLLPMPSHDEQLEIVQAINDKTAVFNTAIERAQREIELIEEYRTTLIAHAVTGKIDVRR